MLDQGGGLGDVHDSYGIILADEELEALETEDTGLWFLVQWGKRARFDWNSATWWKGNAVLEVGIPGETVDIYFLEDLSLADEVKTNKVLI